MSRRHLGFTCEGATLVGTLDTAPGTTGLLMVSGGNEIRSGAWNGQAVLARKLAASGVPVFRFDRRGIGDSEGENTGFRGSADDIRAALAAFRAAAPHMTRVVAWGNCDAASALMLGRGLGCDGLVLSNPWTFDGGDAPNDGDAPPAQPQVLRAHYARRLRDPAALLRLLKGGVSVAPLLRSLRAMARKSAPTTLAQEIREGLAAFAGPVRILLAGRDRTAQAFLGQWDRTDGRLAHCPQASHSFVEGKSFIWLELELIGAVTSTSVTACDKPRG